MYGTTSLASKSSVDVLSHQVRVFLHFSCADLVCLVTFDLLITTLRACFYFSSEDKLPTNN